MNEQTKLLIDLALVQSRIDVTKDAAMSVVNFTVAMALLYVLWLTFGDIEIMAIVYATIMMATRLARGFFSGLHYPILVTALHHCILAVGMYWLITGFFYLF